MMHTSNMNSGHSPDDDSERYILELEDRKFPWIMKTTQVTVRDDDTISQQTPSVKQRFWTAPSSVVCNEYFSVPSALVTET
jgi:hypothetical protein